MADEIRAASWQDIISAEARKQGVDPRLALAVAETESSFNPMAVSKVGARGLMQLMPATAKRLGVNIDDPVENIRGGIMELRSLLDQHGGDVVMALRRYNGSPQASEAATEPYVQAVLGRLKPGGASDSPAAGTPATRGRLVGQPPPQAPSQPQTPEEAAGGPPALPTLPGLQTYQKPIPPPPALGWGETAGAYGAAGLSALGESVDPRTREGRRNLAGGLGAVGATTAIAMTAPVSLPATGLTLLGAGMLGAAGGGMAAEAGEQLVGTAPPSSGEVVKAGGQQAAYEAVGQGVGWGIKAGGRRLIASKVGRQIHEGFRMAKTSTVTRLRVALDAAAETAGDLRRVASESLRQVRRTAAESIRQARGEARTGVKQAQTVADSLVGRPPDDAVSAARRAAAQGIRTARSQSRTGVEAAEARSAAGIARATEPYTALVGQSPETAAAGRAAAAAMTGPATEARNIAGKAVEDAAKNGPDVDITALKAEAQAILERIKPPEQVFPRRVAEESAENLNDLIPGPTARIGSGEFPFGESSRALLEQQAAAGDKEAAAILKALGAVGTEELAAAQEAAAHEMLKHPAMGVINRILNADDVVPFYAAHLWKSELQNALQGTYDQAVKKQVTSITQKLAAGLRTALAGHEPYNLATAKYAQIVPLYTKEYAARLRKSALTDPEALIRLINPRKPTAARMLRDLLVTQSAEGGQASQGQRAWDMVRSAWTQTNLLKGGVEKLDDNLAKLPKEFSDVFYGDQGGSQVLSRLQQIASAYKAAVETGAADVAAAKASGVAGVEAARRGGEASVAAAQRQVGQLRAQGAAGVEAARTAGASQVEATRRGAQAAVEQTTQAAAGVRSQAARDIRSARRALAEGRQLTPEEAAFLGSSLAGRQLSPSELAAHGIRAFGLGPFQIWGGLSWLKLLTGPQERDLLHWGYLTDEGTQWWIKALTGRNVSGEFLANGLRLSGVLDEPKSRVGQSPTDITLTISNKPAQSRVAQPPPR